MSKSKDKRNRMVSPSIGNQNYETKPGRNNHLPINMFHSAAEYRKILITNGKTMVNDQYQVDGIITSLEYVNEPIYQAEQQRVFKNREPSEMKTI